MPAVKQSPVDQPLFDEVQISLLRDALGEDDMRAMLSELPGAAGEACQKITAALGSNDLAGVWRLAHAFKGVASSFGAARLAAIARELELEATSLASMKQCLPALANAVDATLAALPDLELASAVGAKA